MLTHYLPTRRDFLQQAALLSAGLAFLPQTTYAAASSRLQVHVFSKHLHFLSYAEMAAVAKDLGFDGIDLTVRPGGHVEPADVQSRLPLAVEAIRQKELLATMMVTGILNADDPLNRQVLETAAKLGLQHYRMGWYKYPEQLALPEALQTMKKQVADLAILNKKLGLKGAYQNHSGTYVGASLWEIWEMLEDTESKVMGCQYDIRHANVEGGLSWKNGLRLIHSRINTLAIKDCIWEKTSKGWAVVNVPVGEGMIDFAAYFGLLKQYGVQVPVSMHFEYELGGAEHGAKELDDQQRKVVYAAMRRDLERLHTLWEKA